MYMRIIFFWIIFDVIVFFFFSSRRRHTRSLRDWSSDVCSSDLWPLERVSASTVATFIRPEWATTTACRPTDRKSTRLNSSHVEISYAVFCLKKKKKKKEYTNNTARVRSSRLYA